MNRIMALALVGLALLLAAPASQTAIGQSAALDRAVSELETTVRYMEARLERLEALAAREAPTVFDRESTDGDFVNSSESRRSTAPTRIMKFDGVDTIEPDKNAYEQLERLEKEVDALERQVDSQKRAVSSSSGRSSSSSSYRSNRSNRQGRAQGELLAEYKGKYRSKRAEMKKLERELNEPKQIIMGNYQGIVIMLETTTDQSRVLNKIDYGGYLTWTGRRLRSDKSSQEWVVTRIEVADERDIPSTDRR